MSIRLIFGGVLIAGAALLAPACTPTADASESTNNLQDQSGAFCGGFAAIQCPEGYVCVDDPSDDCDPDAGGRDCGGICQKAPKKECNDPNRTYISRDPRKCAAIRFTCETGKVPFFDDCGCGCEPAP